MPAAGGRRPPVRKSRPFTPRKRALLEVSGPAPRKFKYYEGILRVKYTNIESSTQGYASAPNSCVPVPLYNYYLCKRPIMATRSWEPYSRLGLQAGSLVEIHGSQYAFNVMLEVKPTHVLVLPSEGKLRHGSLSSGSTNKGVGSLALRARKIRGNQTKKKLPRLEPSIRKGLSSPAPHRDREKVLYALPRGLRNPLRLPLHGCGYVDRAQSGEDAVQMAHGGGDAGDVRPVVRRVHDERVKRVGRRFRARVRQLGRWLEGEIEGAEARAVLREVAERRDGEATPAEGGERDEASEGPDGIQEGVVTEAHLLGGAKAQVLERCEPCDGRERGGCKGALGDVNEEGTEARPTLGGDFADGLHDERLRRGLHLRDDKTG
ncbi:hypothetical protein FB451DRAFT_1373712 [Mycena latifolia]|nr:hypothetical protein FB451DRAFT_1373712 [Mycena latifolia]